MSAESMEDKGSTETTEGMREAGSMKDTRVMETKQDIGMMERTGVME